MSRWRMLMSIWYALMLIGGGCTRSVIATYDLARLQKGMSQTITAERLNALPQERFVVHLGVEPYLIEVFRISSGGYLSHYLLAYRADELIFWGYPHEFARAQNPEVNEVGALAGAELQRRHDKRTGNSTVSDEVR